jgi:tetratricopeptide (TPR) repeat protein
MLVQEAETLEAAGDIGLAHSKWEAAARLEASPLVLSRLGRSLMLLGKLGEAADTLERAVSSYPRSAEAYFMLGFTYKRQNRLGPAKEILERGLGLQDWPPARVLLGEVYRQLDEPQSARTQLEAALESDPSSSEGWYSLGLTYRDTDPVIATTYFRKAVEADANLSAAHRELGFMLSEAGKFEQAEESLRSALSLDSDDVWAHCYLGSTLKRLRRFSEAEAESRRAIELMPNEPLFWCNLGDIYALEDKWDDAERSYLSALSKDVGSYLANLRYGQFLRRRGYPGKAVSYLERALSSDPGNKTAAAALTEVRSQLAHTKT